MSEKEDWLAFLGVDVSAFAAAAEASRASSAPPPAMESAKQNANENRKENAKQNAKAPAKENKAPADAASQDPDVIFNRYAALYNGINQLTKSWQHPPASLDVSPSDPADLTSAHRRLLQVLQQALLQVAPAAQQALDAWERVAPDLRREVAAGAKFGFDAATLGGVRDQLDYLEKKIFVPGAYHAAKRAAEAASDLSSPDLVVMAPKLAKAEQELGEARSLWETALKIGSSAGAEGQGTVKPGPAIGDAPKTVKEIIEIVQLPGTIAEKLEAARKRGIATTATELVAKVGAATGATLKLVGETGEKIVEARKAFVVARAGEKAAEKTVEQLEKAAGKFKKLADKAKAIGRGASYAAVIADGIRLVSALRDGDYGALADAAVDLVQDAAPLAFGEDLAGPLAIAIIAVKADIEAIHLAAAFIRYCKDERVRQAANDFIADCNRIANGGARQLVADCLLMINADSPKVQQIALEQANREAAAVSKAMRALASQVESTSLDLIGGYPPVVHALGSEALSALTVTFDEKDGALLVAQQIDQIFKGANAMAKYVGENYKN